MRVLPLLESSAGPADKPYGRTVTFPYRLGNEDEIVASVRQVRRMYGDHIKVKTPSLFRGKARITAQGSRRHVDRFMARVTNRSARFMVAEVQPEDESKTAIEAASNELIELLEKGKVGGKVVSWEDGVHAIINSHLPEDPKAAMRMLTALQNDPVGRWKIASDLVAARLLELQAETLQDNEADPSNRGETAPVKYEHTDMGTGDTVSPTEGRASKVAANWRMFTETKHSYLLMRGYLVFGPVVGYLWTEIRLFFLKDTIGEKARAKMEAGGVYKPTSSHAKRTVKRLLRLLDENGSKSMGEAAIADFRAILENEKAIMALLGHVYDAYQDFLDSKYWINREQFLHSINEIAFPKGRADAKKVVSLTKRLMKPHLPNDLYSRMVRNEKAIKFESSVAKETEGTSSFDTCGLMIGDRVLVNAQSVRFPEYRLGTVAKRHVSTEQFSIKLDNDQTIKRTVDDTAAGLLAQSKITKKHRGLLRPELVERCIDWDGWRATAVDRGVINKRVNVAVMTRAAAVVASYPKLTINDRVIVSLSGVDDTRPDIFVATVRSRKGTGKNTEYLVMMGDNNNETHWLKLDHKGTGKGILAQSTYTRKDYGGKRITKSGLRKVIKEDGWQSAALRPILDSKPKATMAQTDVPSWIDKRKIGGDAIEFLVEVDGDGFTPDKLSYPSARNGDFTLQLGRFYFRQRGHDGLWDVLEHRVGSNNRKVLNSRIESAEKAIREYNKLKSKIRQSMKNMDYDAISQTYRPQAF